MKKGAISQVEGLSLTPCLAGHMVLPDVGDCPVSPDLLPPRGGQCLLSLAVKSFCKAILLSEQETQSSGF